MTQHLTFWSKPYSSFINIFSLLRISFSVYFISVCHLYAPVNQSTFFVYAMKLILILIISQERVAKSHGRFIHHTEN